VVLFLLSFYVPLPQFNLRPIEWNFCYGTYTFILAFITIVRTFTQTLDWRRELGVTGLGVAWLANFAVFVRFPRGLLPLPILAPWAIALFYWSASNTTGFLSFPLFYPWALGIALIHGSRYLEAQRRKLTVQTA
jgi:hypothetical protein